MSALEEARKAWLGRTDEWLYERLYEELKQKIEEIHRLLKENANSGYPLLADGCVAMDERRYLSMIADIRDRWMNGSKPEITAMEWMAKEIYNKFIVTEKKATVS